MNDPQRIYFAGDLFDHKDLSGNVLLAAAIDRESGGALQCVLPQHLEAVGNRSVDVRNVDLLAIIEADLILLNFDGLELDSGTVVEFMMAKMLDLPAVVLRTDFRRGGDQRDGDPWNLMASGYPRSRVVWLNAMRWYREAWAPGVAPAMVLEQYHARIARAVVDAFAEACAEPAVHPRDPAALTALYHWARQFPGSGLDALISDERVLALVARRLARQP